MESIRYSVPTVSCNHCKMTIEKALGALEGVGTVAVAVAEKTVTVVFDPERIGTERLEEVLDDEGYPVAR